MRLFADTSFYIAAVNLDDALHTTALDIIKSFKGRVITTEYVLVECANWLSNVDDRAAFLQLNQQIHSDPKTLVIESSRDLYDAGVDLYAKRSDKNWSLTDCISFLVMDQLGIGQALTADRHFQQAGFVALLLQKA